jgi:hypothetical protein
VQDVDLSAVRAILSASATEIGVMAQMIDLHPGRDRADPLRVDVNGK